MVDGEKKLYLDEIEMGQSVPVTGQNHEETIAKAALYRDFDDTTDANNTKFGACANFFRISNRVGEWVLDFSRGIWRFFSEKLLFSALQTKAIRLIMR